MNFSLSASSRASLMNLTTIFSAASVVLFALAASAHAQSNVADHAAHHPEAAASASASAMAEGEVRKIDKEQGKVTLKHGPIAKLDMPGMTMVFKVADAKLLDGVKPGDKVRFTADRVNGAITVTALEIVK
jgi:Cu(I)/Ag(I) efflux system periplasmic protein CusF